MKPVIGDKVVYLDEKTQQLVCGVLAETFVGPLSGKTRARVVDFASEVSDPDAGRTMYYEKLRLPPLPQGQFYARR
jgi:hypothetical protein